MLVSPQHDLSLARALRSPLFGLSDAALVQLALAKGDSKMSWFELLQKQELPTAEFIRPVADLIKYKAWVDRLPPHDALQAIYHDGDVLARFAAAAPAASRGTVLANLRALLNVALQLDGGRYATPYAFVRALKAGGLQAPAAVNPDAVRLLTIHGAKGLEAHSVLLLDTDTAERNADSMSVLVDWPGEAAGPEKFVFLVSESRPPACAAQALGAEQAARQREELNALYVALTRARHTLVMSSTEPYREAPNSWWQRLHALAGEVAVPDRLFVGAEIALADDASARFSLPDLPTFSPPVTATSVKPSAEPDSDSARVGKAMHRLLEWGAAGPANSPLAAQIAREFGLSPAELAEAQGMASRIRRGEGAWAWDDAVVGWQANEVELAHDGQTMRIDRLVQRKDSGHAGQWWILDYKSAHQPQRDPAKIAQMQGYRDALRAIYPGDEVKAAFLAASGALIVLD